MTGTATPTRERTRLELPIDPRTKRAFRAACQARHLSMAAGMRQAIEAFIGATVAATSEAAAGGRRLYEGASGGGVRVEDRWGEPN